MGYSFFSGGLCKTFLFLQEWRFGRSSSSKVIDFGTNRKHICDFLLVRHSNHGPILHPFGDIAGVLVLLTPPPFHPNFGVFPLDQIADVGVSPSTYLKPMSRQLFSKYSKLCDHGTWTSRTGRQTDGQRTYYGTTALCVASRGKNGRAGFYSASA